MSAVNDTARGPLTGLQLNTPASDPQARIWSDVLAEFDAAGAKHPKLIWSPNPSDHGHPLIAKFLDACEGMSDETGLLFRDKLDLEVFGAMAEWLILVEIETSPKAYRFTHAGRAVLENFGRALITRTTEDAAPHIAHFLTATFQLAAENRARFLSCHTPIPKVFVHEWRRMCIPIREDDGTITGFLVLGVAEHEYRAGLEIIPDPILILDEKQTVHYANRCAREMFDAGRSGPWGRSLANYAGITLSIEKTPREMLTAKTVTEVHCTQLSGTLIVDFHATISAIEHHNYAFFVVIMHAQT